MALFTQKPAEKGAWAALPGEPLDRDDSVDSLPEPAVDPLGIGLGTQITSIAFPVMPGTDADSNSDADADAPADADPDADAEEPADQA